MTAADGPSGVACASYRSTVALLQARVRAHHRRRGAPPSGAAAASAAVLAGRDGWVARAVELLGGGPIHVLAPAERIGSAEQSALMLREVPRVAAYACETGDWSHVDVYLTKRPGYGVLLLPGSAYEGRADASGRPSAASRLSSRAAASPARRSTSTCPARTSPRVRPLVETHVAELLAAALWARDPISAR